MDFGFHPRLDKMKVVAAVISLLVFAIVLVDPVVGQFTPLVNCSVTAPKPSYDEVPIEQCLENLGTQLSNEESCASLCVPSGGQCTACRHYEYTSAASSNPTCMPLTTSYDLNLGGTPFSGTLRCIPMKIAPTLSGTFTSITIPTGNYAGTYTPGTFDAGILNAAQGMTTSNFVCAMRDPSKPVLSNTDSGVAALFDGATDIGTVSVLTTGDVDLGFSFQQTIACLQESAAPSDAPTPIPTDTPAPTRSPNSPASTLTMSFASIALMLAFTLY